MTDPLVTEDDIALFLLMHKAIRKDLAALAAAPHAEWFAFLQRSIHLHHTGEEEWLYPTLLAKDPTFAADLEALTEDHAVLDPMTERIARAFAAGSAEVGPLLAELERLMADHLAREEAAVIPRMRRFMTLAELKEFEKREAKRSSFADLALVLPWVLSSADDREREMVFAVLPFPVKVMYRLAWKKRYERLTSTTKAAA